MQFLFNKSDATVDSAQKFNYSLSNRLPNPTRFAVSDVQYTAATTNNMPVCVYLRSQALTNLMRKKHSVQVKEAQRADRQTDVIAVLSETHTQGRFAMKDRNQFLLNPHTWLRDIDFYFTRPDGSIMDNLYTPNAVPGTTLSDLETLYNAGTLKFFADASLASSFTKEDGTQAALNDTVKQWTTRFPDDESIAFTRSTVDGISLVNFDDEPHVFALTQNDNGGSYEYLLDTEIGFDFPDQGSIHFLWETDSSLAGYERIMKQNHFFDLVLNNGSLSCREAVGGAQHFMIHNIQPSTSYLLELRWTKGAPVGSDHNVSYTLNATKLVVDNNQEYSGSATDVVMRSSGSKRYLYLSDAQTGLDSKQSSIIMSDSPTDQQRAQIKNYLMKTWLNQSTTPEVDPNAVDSNFHITLQITVRD